MFILRFEAFIDGPHLGCSHFWEATCERCGMEMSGLIGKRPGLWSPTTTSMIEGYYGDMRETIFLHMLNCNAPLPRGGGDPVRPVTRDKS